jgi:pimeloyl-ACP methyl ester carboxylesterase
MGQPDYDRFSSRDGTSLAYRVSGQGTPVVLVHGYTLTSTTNFATHYRDDGSCQLVAADGPTVESALVGAGCRVVMLDMRGHGHSGRPRDSDSYSLEICADDVRALVTHVGLDRAALIGYSVGAWISCHLLADPWVSGAALCGIGSHAIEGQDPEFFGTWLATGSRCFLEGCWDEYPDLQILRMWAQLDDSGPDFEALGMFARGLRPIPVAVLASAPTSAPVMILNGGADECATDELDFARFLPGADRVVAGQGRHGNATSDPLFHAELTRFILSL